MWFCINGICLQATVCKWIPWQEVDVIYFQESMESNKKMINFVKLHAPWDVCCFYAEDLCMRAPLQVGLIGFKRDMNFNLIVLRMAKTPLSFGHSECSRGKCPVTLRVAGYYVLPFVSAQPSICPDCQIHLSIHLSVHLSSLHFYNWFQYCKIPMLRPRFKALLILLVGWS